MVVIAIIAILAAVAIPMYSNYTISAKIDNEIEKIGAVKADMSEQMAYKNLTPGDDISLTGDDIFTVPSDTPSNIGINASTGVITINVGDVGLGVGTDPGKDAEALSPPLVSGIDIAAITMTPSITSGTIVWTCANYSNSILTNSQLPSNCRIS